VDPDWVLADSNLVESPAWISGIVARNIVIVAFKPGTPFRRREAIVDLIRGKVVARAMGVDGWYTIRVASHPDACTVKQAIDLLRSSPEVRMATAMLVMESAGDGGLMNPSGRARGSTTPCPPGASLLR